MISVVEDGAHKGALAAGVDVTSAVLTLIRGLNEYTPTASREDYHGTVNVLKTMICATLFDADQLS